jgi:hypothetical protein
MPIDDALKEMEEENTDPMLDKILIRIEGVRGVPVAKEKKLHYLREALVLIRDLKQEIAECYILDFKYKEMTGKIFEKKRPAAKLVWEFTEGDFIFCYLIGCIEDRNRLINKMFYPAKGFDYDWDLAAKNPECTEEEVRGILNNYNFHLHVPHDCFKPIRLPTEIMQSKLVNTSLFQFFE